MFVNLHVHDAQGSLLDSILPVDDAVQFAHEHKQPAIAITNHGYMSSFVEQAKACARYGVKPIFGNEIYEVDDMTDMSDTKSHTQPRYHLVLLAKNRQGLKNLFQITSIACTEGFYKKPRIDLKRIQSMNLGRGIICMTACQAGRLSRLLVNGDESSALAHMQILRDIFDYVACEIQAHATDSQIESNAKIIAFAKKYGFPMVVTSDAHMRDASDIDSHAIFVQIGEGREVGESYVDCFLQDESDVRSILSYVDSDVLDCAIAETVRIADMVEVFDIGLNNENQMPIVQIPDGFESHESYLKYLILSTFQDKFGHLPQEEQGKRMERLKMEFPVICALGYVDYFIMVYMLMKEARARKIPLGLARGSAAGCLCLYMLDVTQIDSVLWDLDFSRFANLGRKSLADVDIDISKRRRKEVVEIAAELFGAENVAPIATFNTLSTKVAIRDIGKVLNELPDSPYYCKIGYAMRNEVAKMIPTVKTLNELGDEENKEVLLRDILLKNEKLASIYEQFPLWFKHVMKLEGLPKSMGRHAAGTLITPKPITQYCPVCYDTDKNVICQLEMHNAMDDLKLVKMDFLGLKTLDIIDDALNSAGLSWDDVDSRRLNIDESEVYSKIYRSGNTTAVFQMESAEAKKMLIDAQADNINDIIAVNAANRPGTKDSFPEYCANKACPEQAKVLHEDLKSIFGKTNYILLYQEQALAMFRYAGFPEEEVDNARRAIGKKQQNVMVALEEKFRCGLKEKGWNDEQIGSMWELILKQSGYSFNKAHACAYALLSYITAYLKTHYPLDYMSACLTADSGNVSKLGLLINECREMGISVSPPKINSSNVNFTPIHENNEILFGLSAVKGLGSSIISDIIANRPYANFASFRARVKDKSATIALIKAGAFQTDRRKKRGLILSFGKYLFKFRKFKPIQMSSIGMYSTVYDRYGVDVNDYRIYNVVDREALLNAINRKKWERYTFDRELKFQEHMAKFEERYCKNEHMWEFESLSMFVTYDPLQFAWGHITNWSDIEEGDKAVLPSVIIDVKRKKDRIGNVYCYLDLYTPAGIIEALCWASCTTKYIGLITKGNCVVMYGTKREGNHIFVDEIKPYKQWLEDRDLEQEGITE